MERKYGWDNLIQFTRHRGDPLKKVSIRLNQEYEIGTAGKDAHSGHWTVQLNDNAPGQILHIEQQVWAGLYHIEKAMLDALEP